LRLSGESPKDGDEKEPKADKTPLLHLAFEQRRFNMLMIVFWPDRLAKPMVQHRWKSNGSQSYFGWGLVEAPQ